MCGVLSAIIAHDLIKLIIRKIFRDYVFCFLAEIRHASMRMAWVGKFVPVLCAITLSLSQLLEVSRGAKDDFFCVHAGTLRSFDVRLQFALLESLLIA